MNLDLVADAIDKIGTDDIILRRLAPRGLRFDCHMRAVVRGFAPDELVGGIQQGDRKVIISNRNIEARQWPGPPRRGDQVLIGDHTATVQDVDTTEIGSVIVKHEMLVRG